MAKNICCLVNMSSGDGSGGQLARRLSTVCTVIEIDFSSLSSQLKSLNKYDKIVVVGGDGTISAVVTHPDLPQRPVSFIPMGTANDLSRSLSIPSRLQFYNPLRLTSTINSWPTSQLAIWRFTSSNLSVPFCNYCSIGFDGAVIERFEAWRRKTTLRSRFANRIAYGLIAVTASKRPLQTITLKSGSRHLSTRDGILSLVFSNVQSYLGLGRSNSVGSSSDALIECIQLNSIRDYLQILLSGVGCVPTPKPTCSGKTFSLEGISPTSAVQIDGEFLGDIGGESATISFERFVEISSPSK